MKFKNTLFALMIGMVLIASAVFSSGIASASYDYTTNWYSNGNPISNVRAINFQCVDSDCRTLGARLSDGNSGASNSILVSYPVPSPAAGYGTFWFSPGYRAKKMYWVPTGNGASSLDVNFNKYTSCQAPINSVAHASSVNEGTALAITAGVQSAFTESAGAPYDEPDDADLVRDYFSSKTDITLTIRDSSNNVVNTQSITDYIFAGNSKDILFYWTPNSAQSGIYTISVSTAVSDSKCSSSSVVNSPSSALTVNDVPAGGGGSNDTSAPTFSNVIVSPSSSTNYAAGAVYRFNSTWADNTFLNSVWIMFNGVRYNLVQSGNVYTFTTSDLGAGNYTYQWFANDTSGNVNSTSVFAYNINKAAPGLSVTMVPSTSVQNGTQTNVTGGGCPSVLSCTLFRNGVNVSNPDRNVLAVGTYTYVFNTTGNANYTSTSTTSVLSVFASGSSDGAKKSDDDLIEISDEEFRDGHSFLMDVGDRVKFNFCGAPYYIKLSEIDEKDGDDDAKAYFVLTPGSISFNLEDDENEEFDLNDDKIKDVLFKVQDIDNDGDKAKVYIKRLSNICSSPKKEEVKISDAYGEQLGVKKKPSSFFSLILLLSLLLAVLLLLIALLLILAASSRTGKEKMRRERIAKMQKQQAQTMNNQVSGNVNKGKPVVEYKGLR